MYAVYILIQKVVTILHSVLQVCMYIDEFHLLILFIFDPFVESWQLSLLGQNVDYHFKVQNVDYHFKAKMWIIILRPKCGLSF